MMLVLLGVLNGLNLLEAQVLWVRDIVDGVKVVQREALVVPTVELLADGPDEHAHKVAGGQKLQHFVHVLPAFTLVNELRGGPALFSQRGSLTRLLR